MSSVKKRIDGIRRDIRSAVSDIEMALGNIEYAEEALRDIDPDDAIDGIADQWLMAEVLFAALPIIEDRYGLSSNEAKQVRAHVHTLTKK